MSENIHIVCPNLQCKKVLAVPVAARGKTVRCKSCGAHVRVPQSRSSAVKSASRRPAPPAGDGSSEPTAS